VHTTGTRQQFQVLVCQLLKCCLLAHAAEEREQEDGAWLRGTVTVAKAVSHPQPAGGAAGEGLLIEVARPLLPAQQVRGCSLKWPAPCSLPKWNVFCCCSCCCLAYWNRPIPRDSQRPKGIHESWEDLLISSLPIPPGILRPLMSPLGWAHSSRGTAPVANTKSTRYTPQHSAARLLEASGLHASNLTQTISACTNSPTHPHAWPSWVWCSATQGSHG